MTTTIEPTTNSTNGTAEGHACSNYIAFCVGGGGSALLLIIIIVVVVFVCLRRRRRKKKQVAPPMPDLDEPLNEPADSPYKYQRRNSDTAINDVRLGERLNNDFQLKQVSTENLRSQPMPLVYDDSSDDGDDYVNTGTPDYENNPINRAKAEAEAEQRLRERRNGPSAPLAQSQVVTPSPRLAAPLRHAHTMKPEVNAGTGVTPPAAKPQRSPLEPKCPNTGHTPWGKQYINTSKSLEDLNDRVVPLPPSMPSNSSLAKKKPPGPAPLPKPHQNHVKGYVNQPLN